MSHNSLESIRSGKKSSVIQESKLRLNRLATTVGQKKEEYYGVPQKEGLGPTTQLFILQCSLYNFHFTTFTLQLHSLYNSTHFTTPLTLQLHSIHFTTRLTLQLKFLIKKNNIYFKIVLFVFVRSQVRTYPYIKIIVNYVKM